MENISLELKTTFENLQNELTKNVFPSIEVPESAGMLSEAWFSDMLAWLLDPNESHNFDNRFAKKFMKLIGKLRNDNKLGYNKWSYTLKNYNDIQAREKYNFDKLNNAASVREYYLSNDSSNHKSIDVVFFDLDYGKSFFITIENKLFTHNSREQLKEYHSIINKKFRKIQIREFVYLTLKGDKPYDYNRKIYKINKNWILVSWIDDILNILKELQNNKKIKYKNQKAKELIITLEWLKKLSENLKKNDIVNDVNVLILKAIAVYLHYQLTRLIKGKTKEWKIKENYKSIKISHSSVKTKFLKLSINSNYAIKLEIIKNEKRYGKNQQKTLEKFTIPIGIPKEQIFNVIDMEINEIYNRFFANTDSQKNNNKRRKERPELDNELKDIKDILDFFYANKKQLKILFNFL